MLGNIWKVHDSSPWQNNFISGIQIHNQSPWFKPMAIHSSKAQFSLATLKPNSHWQHQSPILIGKIKVQFLLAISKPNFHWHYFIKKKRVQDYQRLAKKKYHVKMLPWQSSYEKTHWELSWGLCSHIIKPMKYMDVICIATSIIYTFKHSW